MSCCICDEKGTRKFKQYHITYNKSSLYFHFCREHNIFSNKHKSLIVRNSNNSDCSVVEEVIEESYGNVQITSCIDTDIRNKFFKLLILLFWSLINKNAAINTLLDLNVNNGSLLDILKRMSKINNKLYFIAISKIIEILEIPSDYTYLIDSINYSDQFAAIYYNYIWRKASKNYKRLVYDSSKLKKEYVTYEPLTPKSRGFNNVCYFCEILFQKEDDFQDTYNLKNDRFVKQCIFCQKIVAKIMELYQMENILSSGDYLTILNAKIPDGVCILIILHYLFEENFFEEFPFITSNLIKNKLF
jgi:hypothetical protein